MNRIAMTREARQTLKTARLGLETTIREAKAVIHRPHAPGSGASAAQAQLVSLKRQATVIYTALAASRGKLHCKGGEEAIERLRKLSGRGYPLSDTEKLVLSLFDAPAPAPAPTVEASAAA